ncbi:MAG TPA: cellulase family glycosylhydrolase, partial [Solimonas sp.]|nr:cellulase family glycosylhydrolase [Solimonas sp.]
GIEDSSIPMNWGEDFQPQAYQPLAIPADKLVLSPHTYGPDVYGKSSFDSPDYPRNLARDWETLFGQFASIHPVVVGEWGGRYGTGPSGQKDVEWQKALVQYLLGKGIHSSFYWCYTPNSGDTGGILDDQLAVRQDKMELLRTLWGAPGGVVVPPSAAVSPTVQAPSAPVTPAVDGGYLGGGGALPGAAVAWLLIACGLRRRARGR